MSKFTADIAYTTLGGSMAGLHMEGRLISKGKKFATVEVQNGPSNFERRRVSTDHLMDLDEARARSAHNRPEYA